MFEVYRKVDHVDFQNREGDVDIDNRQTLVDHVAELNVLFVRCSNFVSYVMLVGNHLTANHHDERVTEVCGTERAVANLSVIGRVLITANVDQDINDWRLGVKGDTL